METIQNWVTAIEFSWVAPCLKFIFFNVILALTPIIVAIIIAKGFQLPATLLEILKEGELYIFSTTTSGSSIGIMLFQRPTNTAMTSWAVVNCFALLFVIIISCALFGITSYLKLNGQGQNINAARMSKTSASLAGVAILLGIYAFVQGGMQ